MNMIVRFGCRAFQLCFKAIIPILPYRDPEIVNSVDDVPERLKERGMQKVLIVTDAGVKGAGY